MKIGTMNALGLFLLAVGIMGTVIGSVIIYSSLSNFSQCALAPNTVCQVNTQGYLQFQYDQQYGNSAAFYGLMIAIIGIVLYASAQVGKNATVSQESEPTRD